MEGYNEFWKTMFITLFNNPVPDEKLLPMWKQFKSKQLAVEDFKEAFRKGGAEFSGRAQEAFNRMCAESVSSSELLYRMKDDPSFENKDWGVLVKQIRDRESNSLDSNRTLDVIVGGAITQMSMKDLEDNFVQENPDILVSQVCIPETLNHKDNIHPLFNKETLMQDLKTKYEQILQEKRDQLKLEQPKRSEEEVERRAKKAAEDELKKTREAQALQLRESFRAEELVQKSIYKGWHQKCVNEGEGSALNFALL